MILDRITGYYRINKLVIVNYKNELGIRRLLLSSPLERGAGGGVAANLYTPLSPLSRGESQKFEIPIQLNYVKQDLMQNHKKPITVTYENEIVGEFIADIIVNDTIIL